MLPMSSSVAGRLRWVIFGSRGIRAIWSILIFASLLIPMVLITSTLTRHYPSSFSGDIAPGPSLLVEALQLFFVVGATAITGSIEGRMAWLYYGLEGQRPAAKLLAGWIGGLVCLSLVVGMLHAGGFLAFDGWALHGLPMIGYGLLWLVDFLLVGVREEVMYRGYLQATLTRGMGFWPAAILLSVLFGAGHIPNAGETVVGVIGVMIRALLYCFLLRLTGSLWLGIGFHAAWDWAQSFLYGTPQSGHDMRGHLLDTHPLGDPLLSGGVVGPEGSLLWMPPCLLGLVILLWALRLAGLCEAAQHAVGASSPTIHTSTPPPSAGL